MEGCDLNSAPKRKLRDGGLGPYPGDVSHLLTEDVVKKARMESNVIVLQRDGLGFKVKLPEAATPPQPPPELTPMETVEPPSSATKDSSAEEPSSDEDVETGADTEPELELEPSESDSIDADAAPEVEESASSQ